MSSVFIIHGTEGNPQENWFPRLAKELEAKGNTVFVPAFPTPEGQSLQNWEKAFFPYLSHLTEDTILIGHSLGCAFLLSVLEKLSHPVAAVYLVAGFIGLLGNPYDVHNSSFTTKTFNRKKIGQSGMFFCCINSSSDPYVPLAKGEELAKNLKCTHHIIQDAGHFNTAAGYTTFPFLLETIENNQK